MTALFCFGVFFIGFAVGFALCGFLMQPDERDQKLRNAMSYADGYYHGRRSAGAEL